MIRIIWPLFLGLLLPLWAFAQTGKSNQDSVKNTYVSEVDKSLTIHKIGVLPVSDNVNSVYSRPVESKINSLIKDSHRFELVDLKEADPRPLLEDYENNPTLIKNLGQKFNAQAFIGARIFKEPKAVNMTLDLFLVSDGTLLAQEQVVKEPRFDTASVERKITETYNKLINKIPYKGLVLSRQGNRVTLDIGSSDGIMPNTIVSVEQILALKRHPKFKFLLSTEKEIIGKIKVAKVEETLSFGVIVQEKERGVISPESKITGIDFVNYDTEMAKGPEGPARDLVSFGKNPKEWVPNKRPTIGLLGLALGLGSSHYAMSLVTGGNPVSFASDVAVYPQLDLHGEIWITTNWFLAAQMRQGVYSANNGYAGSTPTSLAATNSHYDLHAGYKFLLQDDFWGPQINLHLGFSKYSLFVDASTPLGFTSTSYSGMYLGIGGSVPISEDRTYYFDVNLTRHLFPVMTETPYSSGANSDNSITTFSFGGSHRLTNQFWIQAHLNFEFYATTFSGTGTRPNGDAGTNTSQSLMTLFGGIDYYF